MSESDNDLIYRCLERISEIFCKQANLKCVSSKGITGFIQLNRITDQKMFKNEQYLDFIANKLIKDLYGQSSPDWYITTSFGKLYLIPSEEAMTKYDITIKNNDDFELINPDIELAKQNRTFFGNLPFMSPSSTPSSTPYSSPRGTPLGLDDSSPSFFSIKIPDVFKPTAKPTTKRGGKHKSKRRKSKRRKSKRRKSKKVKKGLFRK